MINFQTFDNMKRDVTIDNGIVQVISSQDVQPILKMAEESRNNECKFGRRKEEFRKYASVPVVFIEAWMKEYGITDMGKALSEIIMHKVNTEFQAFKTTNTIER